MHTYEYRGPVMEFGRCVEQNWVAHTTAVSMPKALSNLKYRYKMEHNRNARCRIYLTGELKEVD